MSNNLKALVNYEMLHELRLSYPNDEKRYVGITMMLRSSSSEAATPAEPRASGLSRASVCIACPRYRTSMPR